MVATALVALPLASRANVGVITAPNSVVLIPSTANQSVGKFELSDFNPATDLLVSVGFVNPPAGTSFSISQTTGLVPGYGYDFWTGLTQVSFVAKMADANAALDSLRVSTGSTKGDVTIKVSAIPNPTGYAFNPVNQHFYQYVSKATWQSETASTRTHPYFFEAISYSSERSFDGVNGYLVTITSSQENQFVKDNIQGALNIWIGASDEETEGDWKWVTGPEAGTLFWRGVANGTAQGGNFNSWAPGAEPNNSSNEDAAVTNWNTADGKWNDLSTTSASVGGFVIEYSAWNNQTFASLRTAQATARVDNSATITAVTAGNNQANVEWSAPLAGVVTSYTVTATAAGKTTRTCTSSGTSCVVAGLENGVTYSFVVTANFNDSTSSNSLSATKAPLSSALTVVGPGEISTPATVATPLGTFTLADPFSCGWGDLQVTVTASDAQALLSVSSTAGVTVSGNESAVLSLRGSRGAIETALAKVSATASTEGEFTVETKVVPSIRFVTGGNTFHFNPENGHYYRRITTNMTWEEAQVAAKAMSFCGSAGYLVAIDDEAEMNFIRGEALEGNSSLWTSGFKQDGTWKWLTGPNSGASDNTSLYAQTNTEGSPWHANEPNNSGNYHHIFYTGGKYGWDDVTTRSQYSLVEFGSGSSFTVPIATTRVVVTAAPAPQATTSPGGGSTPTPTPSVSAPATEPTPNPNSGTRPEANPQPQPTQSPTPAPAPLAGPAPLPQSGQPSGGTIGGQVVEPQVQAPSSSQLDVKLGDSEVKFNVDPSVGGVSDKDGKPELGVKRDESVNLAGDGMLPGSTIQLWLPNSSGAKELGRITVGADGTYDGQIQLTAGPNQRPLPIGANIVQVTGVNEKGEQVVLNLTIKIAQPTPAPELILGTTQTPAPGFGNFLATNGGSTESAVLTALPSDKSAVIEGTGWSMSLSLSGDGSEVREDGNGVFMTLTKGEGAVFAGDGFMPGTIATIWLFSDPLKIGEVTINADGSFSGETDVIGEAIASGEHTIQIQGVGEDGFIRAANLGVVIANPAVALAAPPVLFMDWFPLILLGLVVIVGLASWLVLRGRRRSRVDSPSNVIQFPRAA